MNASEHEHKSYVIHIDRNQYKVQSSTISGVQLRALPDPPIGTDRDLFQVVPGGQDILIGDGDIVELKEGMHFVTAPRNVTPGAGDVVA